MNSVSCFLYGMLILFTKITKSINIKLIYFLEKFYYFASELKISLNRINPLYKKNNY